MGGPWKPEKAGFVSARVVASRGRWGWKCVSSCDVPDHAVVRPASPARVALSIVLVRARVALSIVLVRARVALSIVLVRARVALSIVLVRARVALSIVLVRLVRGAAVAHRDPPRHASARLTAESSPPAAVKTLDVSDDQSPQTSVGHSPNRGLTPLTHPPGAPSCRVRRPS